MAAQPPPSTVPAAAPQQAEPLVKVYRRRWLLLALFVAVIGLNAAPWLQYCVIEDVTTAYYGVSGTMVEWTSLVFNVTAMLLAFPAAWLLDQYGLRRNLLIGAGGTALGMWLKVAGCWQGGYWITLLGQVVVSASTNFVISSPARFAAVWFPANEVSTALGAGLFGQMGGISLGCALAPLTARADWSDEDIFWGFMRLNLSLAVVGTLLLLAVICLFQDAPPLPPSPAQAAAKAAAEAAAKASAQSLASTQTQASDQPLTASTSSEFVASMRRICSNMHFMVLLVSYTLIVSVFIAVNTLLNRFVTHFFKDASADAGFLATLMTLTGMGGIVVVSTALDRTKWFKELSVALYAGSLATCVLYTVTLSKGSMHAVYWVSAAMGAFMSGFFVAGFEMAAELTYPEPEGNPTSFINWMFQPFALSTTLAYSQLFEDLGADAANYFLCGLLALGLVAAMAIPRKYNRLHAEKALASLAKDAKDKDDKEQVKVPMPPPPAAPSPPSPPAAPSPQPPPV
ncbi:feline leukemia virus subgroup C receptor-related protein 2-like [Thrips palmi]|uniref:Feline leukemia virus subgroup C receptor-related protein 2-like n=1 Tax=Thrips palmi TaxID=161013 RepID=A0A6P9AHP9_THRPL|nr:feline leukemia virus subgroup C receptor-related protein 2-like [Thrips palmi]